MALNVIDVAGQLQLTQAAMEGFAKANPKLVSKIAFSQAPAPEQIQSSADERLAAGHDQARLFAIFLDEYHVATGADWQQSAKRLVDILITGSRPVK